MSRRGVQKTSSLSSVALFLLQLLLSLSSLEAGCVPRGGCSQALAAYTVVPADVLTVLASRFQTTLADVLKFNNIPNPDRIDVGQVILFPFPCNCIQDGRLGYSFVYQVNTDDTVSGIASGLFDSLSRQEWIAAATPLNNIDYIFSGLDLKVPVNCSCGDPRISSEYGLFVTYAAHATDTLSSVASKYGVDQKLLAAYNPSVNNVGNLTSSEILFIPGKARNGTYPPFVDRGSGSSSHTGIVIGASVGGAVLILAIVGGLLCCCCVYMRRGKGSKKDPGLPVVNADQGLSGPNVLKFSNEGGSRSSTGSGPSVHGGPLSDFTVDKSVEFSFEELAAATNNFNAANKIGEGGYGAVYIATLRGQKMAVKRMNLQATREFLAELQVLTHVHHTNLVQLIGYCTVDSLFLIYEYVENGTLDQHLHGRKDLPTLPWSARVQIALDAARGLEYIHEHTKPTYIHRDVKSSNILIDKALHAKVADFGLTKLTESGVNSFSMTLPTRLVGTFGYMSPEYARFGDVSPKVDVYSFGVVLFEIISAKDAIVRTAGTSSSSIGPHKEEQKGLVTLFEAVLKDPDGKDKIATLVDPALGSNYPLESAWKLSQLAGACTQENPELRPSMRTAVVALMTLSSSTQDWEISSYGSDRVMTGLISGR